MTEMSNLFVGNPAIWRIRLPAGRELRVRRYEWPTDDGRSDWAACLARPGGGASGQTGSTKLGAIWNLCAYLLQRDRR